MKETDSKILDLYNGGMTVAEIARKVSRHRSTVKAALVRAGAPKRTRAQSARVAAQFRRRNGELIGRSQRKISMAKLEQMVKDGYSAPALAKYFGCGKGTIFARLRVLREQGRL